MPVIPRRAAGMGPTASLTVVFALLVVACSSPGRQADASEIPVVTVGGLDYTFDLPEVVPSGTVRMVLDNRGKVAHQFALFRLNPGVTLPDVLETFGSARGARDMANLIAIVFADPGEVGEGQLVVALEPGVTYALICTLRDTDTDPPHLALGMIRAFTAGES